MRIAVLGAAGQLGCDLCPRLPGDVISLTRADIDLTRPAALPAAVAALDADVLVNCAAYNFVDKAEAEPGLAFAVNVWGVRALARACDANEVRLVQFSSDYVFGRDAARATPLAETDLPGPVSAYGLSKVLGEYVALAEAGGSLVVRTCGLYGVSGSGGKGGNFVETMLRLAGEGKPIRVVDDQTCTPSYTVDVATATAALIAAGATGLYHVTNAGCCTWYEFAAEIFRQSGLKPSLTPIATAEYGAPARRPKYAVMSNAKLATAGVTAPRPWPEALAAYLAERRDRRP